MHKSIHRIKAKFPVRLLKALSTLTLFFLRERIRPGRRRMLNVLLVWILSYLANNSVFHRIMSGNKHFNNTQLWQWKMWLPVFRALVVYLAVQIISRLMLAADYHLALTWLNGTHLSKTWSSFNKNRWRTVSSCMASNPFLCWKQFMLGQDIHFWQYGSSLL